MVEYKNKLITLQNGGTRNNYYKLYKNGTSKRINKELYLKKVKVGGGYNNNVIQNSIQENINIQNSIPKNINITSNITISFVSVNLNIYTASMYPPINAVIQSNIDISNILGFLSVSIVSQFFVIYV